MIDNSCFTTDIPKPITNVKTTITLLDICLKRCFIKLSFHFEGVLLAVRGCTSMFRGCSRTLKTSNSPPLLGAPLKMFILLKKTDTQMSKFPGGGGWPWRFSKVRGSWPRDPPSATLHPLPKPQPGPPELLGSLIAARRSDSMPYGYTPSVAVGVIGRMPTPIRSLSPIMSRATSQNIKRIKRLLHPLVET